MRRSNEQVISVMKADCITGNMTKLIQDHAADILEARELIKEMRSAFEVIRDNTLNPAHTMTKLGLEEITDTNRNLSLSILEKSKEYAE